MMRRHIYRLVRPISELVDDEKNALLSGFDQFGFVVIQPADVREMRENLVALGTIFGNPLDHVLADSDKVVTIRPRSDIAEFGHPFTHSSMEVHTDGAFSRELPVVVALQCETPARQGGSNSIVDGKALFEYLYDNFRNELIELFDPQAMTIKRLDEQATRAIFAISGGRIQVCFRCDRSVMVQFKAALGSIIEEIQSFLEDPKHQFTYTLAAGDILVLDNGRVLHGRGEFGAFDERKMNRIWFDGRSTPPIRSGFESKDLDLSVFGRVVSAS